MRIIYLLVIFIIANISYGFDVSNHILLSKQISLFDHSEVISNNVANTETSGFKAKRILENTYIDKNNAINPNNYNNDIATYTDMQEGSLMETGNTFDLAISGTGFFAVSTADGIFYTRAGYFTINKDYEIITHSGKKLLDINKGTITLPENYSNVIIRQDGRITIDNEELTQIGIFKFNNLNLLKNIGSNLFTSKEADSLSEETEFKILQGFIEQSNVNKVKQLTTLVEVQRDAGVVTNLLNSYDELTKNTISKLGRY